MDFLFPDTYWHSLNFVQLDFIVSDRLTFEILTLDVPSAVRILFNPEKFKEDLEASQFVRLINVVNDHMELQILKMCFVKPSTSTI